MQKKIYQNLGGLGFCDYILSASEFTLEIETSVITILEAKNESTNVGLGQFIAEMVGQHRGLIKQEIEQLKVFMVL